MFRISPPPSFVTQTIANRPKLWGRILTPFIEAGLAGVTIPDSSRSSKQRYRLTEKGERVLMSGHKE